MGWRAGGWAGGRTDRTERLAVNGTSNTVDKAKFASVGNWSSGNSWNRSRQFANERQQRERDRERQRERERERERETEREREEEIRPRN